LWGVVVFAATVVIGFTPVDDAAAQIVVPCSGGDFGTVVLDNSFSAAPGRLTFVIQGNCIVNVIIRRDDVTLTTDGVNQRQSPPRTPGRAPS
jgi:hypothetical protein